ncbi:MAG: hypothetical protein ACTH2Q_01370, partial [Propionibacteriaceae bacterium]
MSAVLALSACGGDDPQAPGAGNETGGDDTAAAITYEFEEARVDHQSEAEPFVTQDSPIKVTLSDDLAAVIPDANDVA